MRAHARPSRHSRQLAQETPLVEITPKALLTTDAEHQFDRTVSATGFGAMTDALSDVYIRGTAKQPLKDKWAGGPLIYLGVATTGFFVITGPGSPSVLSTKSIAARSQCEREQRGARSMAGPRIGSKRDRTFGDRVRTNFRITHRLDTNS